MKYISSILLVFSLFILSEKSIASDCNTAFNFTPEPTLVQGETDMSFGSETFSGLAECAGPDGQNDAWYQFTALSTSMYIRTRGLGNLDLAIELYASCGGTILNCENSTGAGASELLMLSGLIEGNTYFFRTYHAAATVPNSDDYKVSVAYVPDVQLASIYCGVDDYTTNDIIKSTQPQNRSMVGYYQWRFTELEAPFNVYEVVGYNPSNPHYRLFWLPAIQYGRSYEVAVRLGTYPGPLVGEYSAVCTIQLQDDVLTTKLEEQYSGGIYDFCNTIGADKVSGADKYRWEFNDLQNVLHVEGNLYHRTLRLTKINGLKLGQIYIVNAFATVNGMESPSGPGKFLFTNDFVPNVGLHPAYSCGGTYPINAYLQASVICTVESYTWRFKNTSQPQADLIYTRVGGNRFINLEWVTGLIPGDSYDLDIKARQGQVDGDYSSICNITIGPSTSGISSGPEGVEVINTGNEEIEPVQDISEMFLSVIKSGSTDGQGIVFQISNTESQKIEVELFDINGRLVDVKSVYATEEIAEIEWNVQNLTSGVYILSARANDSMVSKKLSVF